MKKNKILGKILPGDKKNSFLDRFILFLLVLGAVLAIFFLGRWVYSQLPQTSLASHLPADKTVAYLEISDFDLPDGMKTSKQKIDIKKSVNALAGVDIEPMIKNFGTGAVTYALLENTSEKYPVLFVQAKSRSSALNYFESLLLPNEKLTQSEGENPVYSFPQGQSFSFKFFDRYVAIVPNSETFDLLPSNESIPTLEQDENYLKSINQLPRRAWVFGYFDVKRFSFSENTGLNNMLEPLKHAMNHAAFAIRKDEKGFHFNTFVNLNKDMLTLRSAREEDKFKTELAQYIPSQKLALYFGGSNLASEWQNTLESIANLNPSYGIILEGLLRAQMDKFFGQNVDLRNDLYPLFEGEYAFAVSSGKTKDYTLLLSHDDKLFTKKKMEKMAQGFKFLAASFAPKVAVVTLPDGTESRELVPDNAQIKNEVEEIDGYEINCTQVGETGQGFCYALNDTLVVMSTNRDVLIDAINSDQQTHLSENVSYRRSVANLSKITDEVSFLNFDQLTAAFPTQTYIQLLKPILSSFDSATWVKHYFDDGMSSEGYILLK